MIDGLSASPFSLALPGLYLAAGLVAAIVSWRWLGRNEWKRGTTLALGTVWLILATAEYWGAGPWSFIRQSTDLDFALTQHLFLVKAHGGGQFSHAFGGGTDVGAMSFLTGQYLSLERLLISLFPLWIAHGLHKLGVFALGFAGTYLVCRKGADLPRAPAFGLAAFYPVAAESLANITWGMGFGYALIPLAVYVVALRPGRSYYMISLFALATLHSVSSAPTHSGLAFFPAVLIAGLLLRPRKLLAILLGCIVLGLALACNWMDSLLAKAQLSPLTFRAAYADLSLHGIADGLQSFALTISGYREPFWLGLFALGLLLWQHRWKRAAAIGGGQIAAVGLGTVLLGVPWAMLGAPGLRAINFQYVSIAYIFIGLLSFALAIRGGRGAAALMLGLSAGRLAWLLAFNASVWLSEGSLSTLEQGVRRLEARSWGQGETVRVATIPYRLPANLAPIAGLDAADGGYNLILKSTGDFWLGNAVKGTQEIGAGYVSLGVDGWDFKCCASYDVTDHIYLDGLRILNVKYLLSALPLSGEGLSQIEGPGPDEEVPPRSGSSFADRMGGYLRLLADPPPLRVYALKDPLPRVFAAKTVMAVRDEEMMQAVRQNALERAAVVDERGAASLGQGPLAEMTLSSFELGQDAVTATIDAPEGGVLVFNIPYSPFWKAEVDGTAVPLEAANIVHMAVPVPPGSKQVSLHYHRPVLGEMFSAGAQ
ncbi:MAG: hypothetical protein EPN26_11095 [Rhodospirillales bacterium]|nr:MAG: hypothetical protein EPN26_11095 [Rhodospirillales bacterium]